MKYGKYGIGELLLCKKLLKLLTIQQNAKIESLTGNEQV